MSAAVAAGARSVAMRSCTVANTLFRGEGSSVNWSPAAGLPLIVTCMPATVIAAPGAKALPPETVVAVVRSTTS